MEIYAHEGAILTDKLNVVGVGIASIGVHEGREDVKRKRRSMSSDLIVKTPVILVWCATCARVEAATRISRCPPPPPCDSAVAVPWYGGKRQVNLRMTSLMLRSRSLQGCFRQAVLLLIFIKCVPPNQIVVNNPEKVGNEKGPARGA